MKRLFKFKKIVNNCRDIFNFFFLINKYFQRKVTCIKVTFMAPLNLNSIIYKIAKVTFSKGKGDTLGYILKGFNKLILILLSSLKNVL